MSVISRRQKELLLNDVSRMINNNNHTAFANHAKIAECVSNGDLKLFIDAPKKEFVIRYGKKEIRINCSEQSIKELESISFNDKSTINGISDSSTKSSSNVAISTKWASNTESTLNNKAEKYHKHNEYADKDHTHNYSPEKHTHSEYATTKHSHSEYAKSDHTHWNLPNDQEGFEEAIMELVEGTKAWRIIKNIFGVIEFASEAVQTGLIAHLETQITALWAAVGGNTAVDGVQTMSTLGSALMGYSDMLKNAGDTIGKIGKVFEPINNVCQKVVGPINEAANTVGRYAKIVDDYVSVHDINQIRELIDRIGGGSSGHRIPNVKDVLNQPLLD